MPQEGIRFTAAGFSNACEAGLEPESTAVVCYSAYVWQTLDQVWRSKRFLALIVL